MQVKKWNGKDVTELPHVIVVGNPGSGFELYGPFTDAVAASEHAHNDADIDGDWWIMPIYPVDVEPKMEELKP